MVMQTQIVPVPKQLAAVVRKCVPLAGIPQAQREARRILDVALREADLPVGRTLTVWRPPHRGMIDYAPGVFVPRAFEAVHEVSLFQLPEGRAAHFSLRGPYNGLAAAWQRLFEDCKALACEVTGLNSEVYALPGTAPEECGTDLYALLE